MQLQGRMALLSEEYVLRMTLHGDPVKRFDVNGDGREGVAICRSTKNILAESVMQTPMVQFCVPESMPSQVNNMTCCNFKRKTFV